MWCGINIVLRLWEWWRADRNGFQGVSAPVKGVNLDMARKPILPFWRGVIFNSRQILLQILIRTGKEHYVRLGQTEKNRLKRFNPPPLCQKIMFSINSLWKTTSPSSAKPFCKIQSYTGPNITFELCVRWNGDKNGYNPPPLCQKIVFSKSRGKTHWKNFAKKKGHPAQTVSFDSVLGGWPINTCTRSAEGCLHTHTPSFYLVFFKE